MFAPDIFIFFEYLFLIILIPSLRLLFVQRENFRLKQKVLVGEKWFAWKISLNA